MFRRVCSIALIGLAIVGGPVSADDGQAPAQSPSSTRSSGKRIAWTVIGAAAGFGAGVFLGLNAFDDAVNSDRKVWTTAIVGAAAGGLAGAFLSRNVGRAPKTFAPPFEKAGSIDVSWESALKRTATIEPPASGGAGLGAKHAHDR